MIVVLSFMSSNAFERVKWVFFTIGFLYLNECRFFFFFCWQCNDSLMAILSCSINKILASGPEIKKHSPQYLMPDTSHHDSHVVMNFHEELSIIVNSIINYSQAEQLLG